MLERVLEVVKLVVFTRHQERSIVERVLFDMITISGYWENELTGRQRQYFEFVVDMYSMHSINRKDLMIVRLIASIIHLCEELRVNWKVIF